MRHLRPFLVPLLFFSAQATLCQSREATAIDSLIDLSIAKNCFNGEVLVSIGDVPFYERTVGFRDLHTKEPLQANSLFNIGSVSKPFTTVAVLQLQEKQLLSIEDLVTKYIPEFLYDSVRIKHLLSHTSGIAANMDFWTARMQRCG
ncbi:MAG: beta-lactamase family protein [Flavobacteriales bacterium]|nr:beta-lactamase family protein [Flavobacteriales bacterium]